MSEIEPQGSTNPATSPPLRLPGGAILLGIAIILGIGCLPMAFEDPSTSCPAGHGCIALVDFRPIGSMGVVIALLAGMAGVWMVHSGSRPPDEPH